MAAKSSVFNNDLLKLLFNGTSIALLADNSASPTGNLYLALHTASPAVGGTQTTSEAAYTGYARVAVARTTSGFTVVGSSVTLTSAVTFASPSGTISSETETFFSVGTAGTGTGKVMYFGPITPTIAVATGSAAPQLTTGTTITES